MIAEGRKEIQCIILTDTRRYISRNDSVFAGIATAEEVLTGRNIQDDRSDKDLQAGIVQT